MPKPKHALRDFIQNRDLYMKANYSRVPLYARYVTHRLSPFVVYAAAALGIKPHGLTFISYLVGVFAAMSFACPHVPSTISAAICLEIYYVLDAADGQLARYTQNYSKTGSFFDIIGNYIVMPLVLTAVGMGQAFLRQDMFYMLYGVLAALGMIWLGVMWDVRATVLLASLKKGETFKETAAENTEARTESTHPLKALFSMAHKLCTMPSVMNCITVLAIVSWVRQDIDLFGYYLILAAVLFPTIGLIKITKMILSKEIDGVLQ